MRATGTPLIGASLALPVGTTMPTSVLLPAMPVTRIAGAYDRLRGGRTGRPHGGLLLGVETLSRDVLAVGTE